MRRAHQHQPSIIVSEQLTAKILPMTPEHVVHFDPLEDGFFKEGDALSSWQHATDEVSDPTTGAGSPRRWFARRRTSYYAAALGAACVLGLVSFGRLHRATPPRATEPAAPVATPVAPPAEDLVAAKATAEPPAKSPAPAPAAERRTPSSSSPATGAVAAKPQTDGFEACRNAFDRHRATDVLETCPKAIDETPQSAELAVILARTELERGRARQALDWAKKAVTLDAERAEAYVYLGGAEQAAGRSAAARAAYKRYLELAPRGRFAADLRAVLTSL